MFGRTKWKIIWILLVQLFFTVALAVFLNMLQQHLSLKSQQQEISIKMEQIREQNGSATETVEQLEEIIDNIYSDKVESLAYMVREEIDPALTSEIMQRYCGFLAVGNALVLDAGGEVIAQAKQTPADFTRPRFNMLRTVFSDHQPSKPFLVEFDGVNQRYYGAWIDSRRMAVIETEPVELIYLESSKASWEAILENVNVGQHGYAFVINARDYTIYYHPDYDLMDQDAMAAGLRVEDLQDGYMGWFDMYGERFYGGVVFWEGFYIICAIGEDEINSESAVTVGIVLFAFIAVTTVVISYAMILLSEKRKSKSKESDYWHIKKIRVHRQTGAKTAFVSGIGLICILAVSLFMQTLYNLSGISVTFAQKFEDVEDTLDRYSSDVEIMTYIYDTAYLSKAMTAAYILNRHPEMAARDALGTLSDILDVEYIFVFDKNGVMTATDSPYSHFSISKDEKDQSYAFNVLLQGVPYLVQEAQHDDVEHIYRQYVGVTLRDEAGEADGFVQIAVYPELLEEAVNSVDIDVSLRNIKVGTNGFAFAVDGETKDFVWYPDKRYIGRNALDYGMQEDMFTNGDSGYMTLDSTTYYAAVEEIGDNHIFLAIPNSEIGGERLQISILTTLFSLAALCIISLITMAEFNGSEDTDTSSEEGKGTARLSLGRERMIDVPVSGEVKKTESAFSRWSNVDMLWGERTPEQKVFLILKGLMVVLAVIICLSVLYKDKLFDSTSVIRYIINGTWKHSFNIFSVTACIMIMVVVFAGTVLLRGILRLMSRFMDARQETVLRLLSDVVQYVSVIAALYYCFAQFGVNTSTLLASAGIMSLVIGLGAQSLITDILAGLFIIFEGEFRVGDIITVGDWRGTVVEIGVRTTKVENSSGNIKIFNNASISGVVNMTQKNTAATCEVAIDFKEKLERVEEIMKEELPKMREKLEPIIVEGPFYSGVTNLGSGSFEIRILATCHEADRSRLTRKLNREMKLLLEKYELKMPHRFR